MSSKQDASTAITTSNIGSQYVSRSVFLQSLNTDGTPYDNVYLLHSKYNRYGDNRFALTIYNNNNDATSYGVRVDYSTEAYYLQGYIPAIGKSPNTIVVRDSNNYIWCDFINSNTGGVVQSMQEFTSYFAFFSSDGFLRKATLASAQTALNCLLKSGGTLSGWLNYGNGNGRITAANSILFLAANTATYCVNYINNGHVPIVASAFNVSSSRLVKENIVDMTEDEAKKILDLRVVDFDYINGKKNQCGLIAEETLNVAPYCVDIPKDYDEEKAKQQIADGELPNVPCIDYSKLVPSLIKMVQMQQKQIDELREQLNSLL